MEVQPRQATTKGPADRFTGDVWFDMIASGEEPSRLRVTAVRFSPSARTAWHSHAVGQTLYVVDGLGLAQARGGAVLEIGAGDVVVTPPGEWHWHGAVSDRFMTHLAMWDAPPDGPESEWADLVTDEEYRSR
ncbi:MAG TPA: cupin domain-containing protein [Actinomycetota bacterium]